jgi:hypothetical protein
MLMILGLPCWQLVHPTNELLLSLNSALFRRNTTWVWPQAETLQLANPGPYGQNFAPNSTKMNIYPKMLTPFPSSNSLLDITGPEKWLPQAL